MYLAMPSPHFTCKTRCFHCYHLHLQSRPSYATKRRAHKPVASPARLLPVARSIDRSIERAPVSPVQAKESNNHLSRCSKLSLHRLYAGCAKPPQQQPARRPDDNLTSSLPRRRLAPSRHRGTHAAPYTATVTAVRLPTVQLRPDLLTAPLTDVSAIRSPNSRPNSCPIREKLFFVKNYGIQ